MKPLGLKAIFGRHIRMFDVHYVPYSQILSYMRWQINLSYTLRVRVELQDAIETMRTL